MSLFSGGGGGGEGYQFFKQGSQKIVTLPQPLVKKIDPPHFYLVIFFKTLLPWIELPIQIDSCVTDVQSVSYFF